MDMKRIAKTATAGLLVAASLNAACVDGESTLAASDGDTGVPEDDSGDDGAVVPPGPPPPPPPPAVLAVEAQVCPAWRQVVRRTTAGACPDVPVGGSQWVGTKMFPEWNEVGSDYGKYCVYELDRDPVGMDLPTLSGKPWVAQIAADCVVAGTMSPLDDELNPELRALTGDRLDRVTPDELNLPASNAGRFPVRVAVIDTTPPLDPGTPTDDHGMVVADLIQRVAHGCDAFSATCVVEVLNVLGLPRDGRLRGQRNLTDGGFIGFHSEVAMATYFAVRAWELETTSDFHPKLILNFSIAWLDAFGKQGLGNTPGVDATLLALRRASCQDALIIAAAGNDMQDCDGGPMVPAAWEEIAAPTPTTCQNVFKVGGITSGAAYKPLVHSVGGVDLYDEPIALTREGGRPRLAAYADHVVTESQYVARTGTSMAAATVSGIAALVWSYRPNITSHDLAHFIWNEGIPTEDTADYQLGNTDFEIRRATACTALSAACEGSACTTSLDPEDLDCNAEDMSTESLEEAMSAILPNSNLVLNTVPVGQCASYCDATEAVRVATGQPLVCPAIPGPARTDYLVKPQPRNPACTTCYIKIAGTAGQAGYSVGLFASLAPDYATPADTNVTVKVTLADGSVIPYILGNIDLSTTTTKRTALSPPPTQAIVSATVDITFAPGSVPVTGDLLMYSE